MEPKVSLPAQEPDWEQRPIKGMAQSGKEQGEIEGIFKLACHKPPKRKQLRKRERLYFSALLSLSLFFGLALASRRTRTTLLRLEDNNERISMFRSSSGFPLFGTLGIDKYSVAFLLPLQVFFPSSLKLELVALTRTITTSQVSPSRSSSCSSDELASHFTLLSRSLKKNRLVEPEPNLGSLNRIFPSFLPLYVISLEFRINSKHDKFILGVEHIALLGIFGLSLISRALTPLNESILWKSHQFLNGLASDFHQIERPEKRRTKTKSKQRLESRK